MTDHDALRIIAEDIKPGDRVAPRRDNTFHEVAEIRVTANVHLIYTDGGESIIPRHALWWRKR